MDRFLSPSGENPANPQPEQAQALPQLNFKEDKTTGGGANGNNGNGKDSPDSNSLYSDEIPSGYNSGEQYDTLSTGYMSGEAYELPETRMDLHKEPAMDVIEECLQPLQASNNSAISEDNIFVLPTSTNPHHAPRILQSKGHDKDGAAGHDNISLSSSSGSGTMGAAGLNEITVMDGNSQVGMPGKLQVNGSMKNKLHRKKMTTFSIPMERDVDPESSDFGPGADASTGGYRAVPSDTDTSAFDSDANAMILVNQEDSAGEQILQHASIRAQNKAARLAARKAKKARVHDEAWFDSHDNKSWKIARFVCFYASIFAMAVSFVVAGILIYFIPTSCNPHTEWYQGSVAINVRPTFEPLTGDWKLDLAALEQRLPDLKEQGVSILHLKDLTVRNPKVPGVYYPAKSFLAAYDQVLGNKSQVQHFVRTAHKANFSLMVQIPVVDSNADSNDLTLELDFAVSKHIAFWSGLDVDGVFLDGLERFSSDALIANTLSKWQLLLTKVKTGRSQEKIIMTSYKFAENLHEDEDKEKDRETILSHIKLLDATVNLSKLNFSVLSAEIASVVTWDTQVRSRPWINWNLDPTSIASNNSKAAVALQFLLPGTVSLEDGSISEGLMSNLSKLRAEAVPIHMNGLYRGCDCPNEEREKEPNYSLASPVDGLVQLDRFFVRRRRFVLVANFAGTKISLAPVAKSYSVGAVVIDTHDSEDRDDDEVNMDEEVIGLETLTVDPGNALVIKLPK